MPKAAASATAFPELEPGNVTVTSTHLTFKGYSQTDLESLKQLAESLYNKIGNDTGLYAFMAGENFTVTLYKDHEEYTAKTHEPDWSRAVTSGKGIYLYPSADLEATLAHQMTHLIFDAYMGDKAASFRWLKEGLAMVEEVGKMADSDRTAYLGLKARQLREDRKPFSQMTFFVTNTEEKRRTDSWYQQVESVVAYLLSQGSPLAFAQLLGTLRSGSDIDRALSESYAGKFRSLSDLEAAWKYTI